MQDDGAVSVSWPKDRKRYGRVLWEFPIFRDFRSWKRWLVILSVPFSSWLLGAGALITGLSLVPAALLLAFIVAMRRSMLAEVGTGTLTWRVDPRGVRIEGDTATEIPWSQMLRWRCTAGHVVIEVRRPSGKQPNAAVAAPLAAFGPLAWERTEVLLRDALGDADGS